MTNNYIFSNCINEKERENARIRVSEYPIPPTVLLNHIEESWDQMWNASFGSLSLMEAKLPSQVIGSLFERILGRNLSERYPKVWSDEGAKHQKDFVNLVDEHFSTELKLSGQRGYSIYGNRSYCMASTSSRGKSRDGYYITVNYIRDCLTMVRLGWLTLDDWNPQKSNTGQSAKVDASALSNKMLPLVGNYVLRTPIECAYGVGDASIELLASNGICNFDNALRYTGHDARILKVQNSVKSQLLSLREFSHWEADTFNLLN